MQNILCTFVGAGSYMHLILEEKYEKRDQLLGIINWGFKCHLLREKGRGCILVSI